MNKKEKAILTETLMNEIIQGNRVMVTPTGKKFLRFMQDIMTTDISREQLTYFYVKEGFAYASDGVRLVKCELPIELDWLNNGAYSLPFKITHTGSNYKTIKYYPNKIFYKKYTEMLENIKKKTPKAYVAINLKLLKDIIKILATRQAIVLCVYEKDEPILISTNSHVKDFNFEAIIMPMHVDWEE